MNISDNQWNDVQFLAQTFDEFSELPASMMNIITLSVGDFNVVSIIILKKCESLISNCNEIKSNCLNIFNPFVGNQGRF